MKKRIFALLLAALCLLLAACAQKAPAQPEQPEETAAVQPVLDDGTYAADFSTDSSMFHVNETKNGKGTLTVENGEMTIHISLPSKSIVNLFLGTAEDAQKDGAELLQPTLDEVSYPDGTTEEVHGFDIPVPYLDEEFDCALIGTKGKWYDHKVSVSNPVPMIADGTYTAEVTLTGGSGRAFVESPATITVKDGAVFATVVWSSPHYEYMTVDGVQYDPVNTEGNSTFVIPITLDEEIAVSALTTAMSEPHLIDYSLYFNSATLQAA